MNMITCPNCGTQMRPTPVVWKQGTSVGGSSTFGVGFAGGQLVPVVAGTSSRSQSRFAAELGPPKMRELGYDSMLLIAFAAVSPLIAIWLSGFASPVTSVFSIVTFDAVLLLPVGLSWRRNNIWNRNVYPIAYTDWENSQVCMNCGHGPVIPRQHYSAVQVDPAYRDPVAPPIQDRQPSLRMPQPPLLPPGFR